MSAFSPASRVRLYFFVQFMSIGMVNAYAGIWFDSQGLSSFQIGMIGAVPNVIVLCIILGVGKIADRASDWKQVIIVCAVISALAPIGLFYVTGFIGILIFWSIMSVSQRAALPVSDAAAMRMARREGLNFGGFRGLSTLGYLLVVIIAGYFLRDHGVVIFLPLFVALGLLRGIFSFALPRLRAQEKAAEPDLSRLSAVMKPWFLLPLLGYALIDTPHIILNSFQGLLWAKQGISTEVIGLLIALGAAAETVMFFVFVSVAKRFKPLTLIMIAAGASVVRWVAMAMSPDIPYLIALQTMHAITYAAAFLAITNFIADTVSEDNAAEAQSLLVILELTISALGVLAFGWLAGHYGANAYLASAAFAVIGGMLVFSARPPARPA